MNRTTIAYCMILGLCGGLCSTPLAAAWWHPRRHTGQQKVPTSEAVNLQGVVQSITATHIEVIADKPTGADSKNAKSKKSPHGTWSVLISRDTPIQVTGEATPDYLHHGIMVRFTAPGKGQGATEEVHELTIVTAASHKAASKGTTASKPTDNSALASAAQRQETGRTVIGQLGHLHDNKWSVVADDKTWHIELADDVKIKVAFTGSHFVSPGDKIVVQGEMVHGKPGICTASDVQVTLAKPLGASKDAQQHKSDAEVVLPGNTKF
jgi:hypothetical protein